MDKDLSRVVIARSSGLRFFGGFSSSYAVAKDGLQQVAGVLTGEEIYQIITSFNEAIQTYWPCTIVYCIGLCCPCCPIMCVAKAEEAGMAMLHQISLREKYYDRQVCFHLVKPTWFSSQIVVSLPTKLLTSTRNIPISSSMVVLLTESRKTE